MHIAYDRVGEVVNSFFVADESGVNGVDDERRPADDEHDDDEDERDGNVPLLGVHLVLADRRAVSQVTPVRTDLPQHAAWKHRETHRNVTQALSPPSKSVGTRQNAQRGESVP